MTRRVQQTLTKVLLLSIVGVLLLQPVFVVNAQAAPPGGDELTAAAAGVAGTQGGTSAEGAAEKDRTPEFTCLSVKVLSKGESYLSFTCVLAFFAYWAMTASAFLMGQAGVVLNFAVIYLVEGMGQLVLEMGIGDPWAVLRDVANVFLVFLTLFIGIATILGISGYGYKTLLWKVILAALLVNFSLLFTQVIVDVSNLAASAIHTQLASIAGYSGEAGVGCDPVTVTGDLSASCATKGISGAFMTKMNLMKIYQASGAGKFDATKASVDAYYERILITSIAATPMFLVGAFVFAVAALLLVYRFIALVFLMVLSAPAFVFFITKQSGEGSRWWSTLIKESFFAPLMFLLFWVSYVVLDRTVTFLIGNANEVGTTASNANMFSVKILFSFTIVCFFLIGSLIIARSLGARGAAGAISLGSKWGRAATVGVAGGVAGWAGAQTLGTIGRGAAWVQDRGAARAQQMQDRLAGTTRGRILNAVTLGQFKAGSTIDRAISGAARGLENTKFLGTASLKERNDAASARLKEVRTDSAKRQSQDALAAAAQRVAQGTGTDADRRLISSASQQQLEWLRDRHRNTFAHQNVAQSISERQMTGMEQNAQFTDVERAQIREHRATAYTQAINDPNGTPNVVEARRVMGNMSEAERRALAPEIDRVAAETERLEAIAKAPGATPAQIQAWMNSQQALEAHLTARRPEDIEHLAPATVLRPQVADHLTGAHLRAMDRAGHMMLSQAERVQLRTRIERHGTKSAKDYLRTPAAAYLWA